MNGESVARFVVGRPKAYKSRLGGTANAKSHGGYGDSELPILWERSNIERCPTNDGQSSALRPMEF